MERNDETLEPKLLQHATHGGRPMLHNRSMPDNIVIPVLEYHDVDEAVDWLCSVFRFELRLRIAGHRAQLCIGGGAIIITQMQTKHSALSRTCSVMVRIDDVNDHYIHALRHGASMNSEPTDYPYGERQYSCRDIGGHNWTFSQSIADISPEQWGGVL
jgi:uncharacterized glyoxalase superfamily protein PhnB